MKSMIHSVPRVVDGRAGVEGETTAAFTVSNRRRVPPPAVLNGNQRSFEQPFDDEIGGKRFVRIQSLLDASHQSLSAASRSCCVGDWLLVGPAAEGHVHSARPFAERRQHGW